VQVCSYALLLAGFPVGKLGPDVRSVSHRVQLAKEEFCANISSEKFNAMTLRGALGDDLIQATAQQSTDRVDQTLLVAGC